MEKLRMYGFSGAILLVIFVIAGYTFTNQLHVASILGVHGQTKSVRVLHNDSAMSMTCTEHTCILHASHSLHAAIQQLNMLLTCITPQLATSSHWIWNQDSVTQCLQCNPLGNVNVTFPGLPDIENISSAVPKKSKLITVNERDDLDYFHKASREPLVFGVMLSWQPTSNWQLDWPFNESKVYPKRRVSKLCTNQNKSMHTRSLDIYNNNELIKSSAYKNVVGALSGECRDNLRALDHPRPLQPRDFENNRIFVHIIRQGVINNIGIVRVGTSVFIPWMCRHSQSYVFTGASVARHKFVFVASMYWGEGFFHLNVEDIPRLMPYLDFLRKHPEIKIHGRSPALKPRLSALGLDPDRYITGIVKADVAFLPQGGGCGGGPHVYLIEQLLHRQYAHYIQHVTHRSKDSMSTTPRNPQPFSLSPSRRPIILIHRTSKRWLAQHSEITVLLQEIAHKKNLPFEVFSDKPSPDFPSTVELFSRAGLVVAPHGAGLSNLLFSPAGTRVVEILCNPKPNFCYQNLHTALGQPYVGLLSVKPRACGPLFVDLVYLKLVVISLLE